MNTLQQNRFFMKTVGILLACIMVFTGAVPAMAYGATDDEKAAAQEYIEKNFTNSKIITTGGSGVTQTGTTCTIGLKTSSTSTSMITSFRLKNASESDGYKSGWYVADQSLLDLGTKTISLLLRLWRSAGFSYIILISEVLQAAMIFAYPLRAAERFYRKGA